MAACLGMSQESIKRLRRYGQCMTMLKPISFNMSEGHVRCYWTAPQGVLPIGSSMAAWPDASSRLMELQENCARNDLTGAQRKEYAAEIGRLLSNLAENSTLPIWNDAWL